MMEEVIQDVAEEAQDTSTEVTPEIDKDRLAGVIWNLVNKFEIEDEEARTAIFNDALIGEYYWSNRQFIFNKKIGEDLFSPEVDKESTRYFANEYRPNGESIIAAMAIAPPKLDFYPDDAENANDLTTAQAYQRIAQLIEKHNHAPQLLTRILYILYNEPYVAIYSYLHEDKKYGTYEKPQYEDIKQIKQKETCPSCGAPITPNATVCDTCGEPIDSPEVVEEVEIVKNLVGKTSEPKSRVCLNAFGPLHVQVAPYAQRLEQSPYLILRFEEHPTKGRYEYKELRDVLVAKGGTSQRLDYEKEYRGELFRGDTTHLDTWTCIWFRPSVFETLNPEDELYAHFVSTYPDGLAAIFVNDTLVEMRNESMDDHWTLNVNPLSTYIAGEPLGKAGIPLQDVTNEILNLSVDTMKHGIPQTWATTDAVDFDKYRQSKAEPGMIYPAKQLTAGDNLANKFHTVKTATLSQEVKELRDSVKQQGQHSTGAFPSIYGGVVQGSRTASEYAQSRSQALQRLSITWGMVKMLWANTMSKACTLYAKMLLNSDYDERYVQKQGVSFINIWIKRAELTGTIGNVEPEIDEQLPTSWAQQRDVLMRLIEMNNPLINEVIGDPDNSVSVKGALGFKELKIPGYDSRIKQLDEIQQILTAPPEAEVAQIDEQLDDHEIEASTCKSFLISATGLALRNINPQAYQKIREHWMQHMQVLVMRAQEMQSTPTANNGETNE